MITWGKTLLKKKQEGQEYYTIILADFMYRFRSHIFVLL